VRRDLEADPDFWIRRRGGEEGFFKVRRSGNAFLGFAVKNDLS
jgi:hypothetical protein